MISIIHFGSPKIQHIQDSLTTLGYASRIFKWEEFTEADQENTSAYVLSGSPLMITETDITPHILHYDFLKNVSVPVLGICYGHQLLGILYGAKYFKGKDIRKVETNISILEKTELFEGFGDYTMMLEDHTEAIHLPEGFIHLASSEIYEVEAMRHARKLQFGVQFHPEVSGENGLHLLSNFCKLI